MADLADLAVVDDETEVVELALRLVRRASGRA
jgi:hypothetical protein